MTCLNESGFSVDHGVGPWEVCGWVDLGGIGFPPKGNPRLFRLAIGILPQRGVGSFATPPLLLYA